MDLLNKPACHPKLVLSSPKVVTHDVLPVAPLLFRELWMWSCIPSLDWSCALITLS